MIRAANEFFSQLEAIFQTLYPFQPESKMFLVTSINPEAGRHPVPTDAREMEAALRAADVCWERFPYFERRYGERGRRFARSDAAWQATLYQYEPEQIIQQARWLGRVLPTLLLQAAAALSDPRRRHFNEEQMQTLAAEFDHAVGQEWSEKFRHTGVLP